jgi:hypothetical protein
VGFFVGDVVGFDEGDELGEIVGFFVGEEVSATDVVVLVVVDVVVEVVVDRHDSPKDLVNPYPNAPSDTSSAPSYVTVTDPSP